MKEYKTIVCDNIDISKLHSQKISNTEIEIIDGYIDHVKLLETIFDFEAIRQFFKDGFTLRFDAMNAVTGPEAKYLFEEVLGAKKGSVVRGVPMEDFGGVHPDPNLSYNKELVDFMYSSEATDLGAACDGDGDRNMIVGRNFFVSPGDSLALIVERAKECIEGFSSGLLGVARSMPTSRQVNKVADALGIKTYEVPTGWKFFANLMDANKCSICGEESFGTSSDHIREKDGLWAILCWINIMAKTGLSVEELMTSLWKRYGRYYYQRQDFENLDKDVANRMFESVRENMKSYIGQNFAESTITDIDDFCYKDPIDGSITSNQGIRISLADDSRVVS
ncbi:MAG: alpha-D-glucose phosphate-specific phosphoglucomutase [Bdellovibrionota bacterium]